MADFTPTQGRYLAFIHAYTNLHGYAPAQPTEPRCSGPGVASDELVRRIGLLAEWTYQ